MQNTESTSPEESATVLSLADRGVKRALAKKIKEDVNIWCADEFDDGFRTHLGGSQIGKECSRELWYGFRWIGHKKFDGRMQRLFQRGHREEDFVLKYLEGIGCQVWAFEYQNLFYHDPTDEYIASWDWLPNETTHLDKVNGYENHEKAAAEQGVIVEKRQIRVSAHHGHFGGAVDAVVKLPERYGVSEPMLLSIKTSATGSLFAGYDTKGLQQHKPVYYGQECSYGKLMGIKFALFVVANKNDDDIYIEIVSLSDDVGDTMLNKAKRIIFSQTPPEKLSMNPTFQACAYCDKKGVCHGDEKAERNCRSCKHATPVENKDWHCAKHNGIIPKDFIPKGCDHWFSIIEEE